MSLALIQESAKEVRRLAIAGSPLAVGDFRLKKLAAPLEQAGAKVPVFAQVAKAINDLVNGKEADSATNLLNLSTLLNAILYTQGQSGTDGAYRELEMVASNCASTRTPARVLKPLVQALTSTGSGRFETVKSAVERGAFNDLRLIDPAIQALGDIYPELADFVAEKILPGYGPGIVPRLKAGLDLKGKKQDGRRLQIMHQLDPVGTIALCKTALEDGSPEVKAAAIACLGKHEDCLPLVLEQANAKNKLLRAAALEALAEHDRPEVTKLFTELVTGKALDILAGPFRALKNRQVLNSLLEEGKRVFALLLKGDSEQIPRYWEILDCLNKRKDSEVEDFVLNCFSRCDKLVKVKAAKNSHLAGADIITRLTSFLYEAGSPRTLKAVLDKRETLPPMAFSHVLHSALRTWTAAKFFEEFVPLLGKRKGAGKERYEDLNMIISTSYESGLLELGGNDDNLDSTTTRTVVKVPFDARWLDAVIKADDQDLVCSLARPGHKEAVSYLLKAAQTKKQSDIEWIVEALARCGYPQVTNLFLEHVTRLTKKPDAYNLELQALLRSACFLPAGDLPILDAYATKLDEKFVDLFLEALAPLRITNQTVET
jgi:hypothetical protein